MISGITIVCREVDKNTGAVAAYVCKKMLMTVTFTSPVFAAD